jgi:hypothetical protein
MNYQGKRKDQIESSYKMFAFSMFLGLLTLLAALIYYICV